MKKQKLIRAEGLAAIFLALFLIILPPRAFAQCEQPGVAAGAAAQADSDQLSASQAMTWWTNISWAIDLDNLRRSIGDIRSTSIIQKFDEFWARWKSTWVGFTDQVASATTTQTMHLGAVRDANDTLKNSLEMQKLRIQSKLRNQPTDQACIFDTTSAFLTPTRSTGEAMASAYELDFTKLGNNNSNSVGANGFSEILNWLWANYFHYNDPADHSRGGGGFCDPKAENGNSGCPSTDSRLPNMDATPGKLFFERHTIPMYENPNDATIGGWVRTAVWFTVQHITGFKVPDPILPSALLSNDGIAEIQRRRAYLTQMNAVAALLFSLVSDRTPGPPAPDVKNLRISMGVDDANDTPSLREVRQSFIEQLWTPEYYKDLYDNPSTVAQKEVYLKAYNLMMLYDMISRQEKISNIYALQTANLLRGTQRLGAAVTTNGIQ